MNDLFYPRVELLGEKRVLCTGCNERLVRKTTFHQLLSPFNTNVDGTVKTRRQILDELRQELAAWRTLPASHADCNGTGRGRVIWVKGHCPACGRSGLFIGEGGYVTCSHLECPVPDAASTLLEDKETEHVVRLDAKGWTIRHPLKERLGDALMSCRVHDRMPVMDRLESPGAYRVRITSEDPCIWDWEKIA